MKPHILFAFVLACAAALVAPEVHADAAVSFVINDRPAKVPVARVRWSFALAAAAAGSSVTIGGATATLGGGFVTLGNGDRFRLDATTSMTNGVSLLYEARSHFTGTDFCTLSPGLPPNQFPKTVTVQFTGPGITKHAMGAYTVAGVTAATTLFCQQAKRRVQDGVALGTAPPGLGLNDFHRLPLDVILVLDKSGSMGWELPGAPINSAPSRWTVLGTALDQLVAFWEQASETGVTGDRLGLVHFGSVATPGNFAGSIFKKRGDWDPLLTAAKAPLPGGGTAIGAGLNTAITNWTGDPANFDAVVVLMTDGEQNVAPLISKIPSTDDWALAAAGSPVAGVDELYRKGLPIQTIGFGTPAAVEASLLGGIAEQTAGTSIITATASGLSQAMQDVLVQALKGNTLGMLARVNGTVTSPAQVSGPIPLQVDASVRRVTAVLDWTGRRGLFDLALLPPGGGNPVTPVVRKVGPNWLIASVDVPASGPSGEWRALVRANDLSGSANFRLSAYAVDSRLKYSLNFGHEASGTGDAIPLMVELTYDGKPLAGISGGIRLAPAAPPEGAGNILHAAGPGPAPRPDQDATTAKALELVRSANLIGRTEPKLSGSQLVLADANDAVYTANVVDTRVPGRYRFDVALEWDDARTGKVRRIESVYRTVAAVPNPNETVVVVAPPSAGGTYQVTVTPRDRFGNYVGPGYGRFVQVKLNGAGTVGPVSDPAQTGDYVVQVSGVAPGSTPTMDIVVDGKPVRAGQPLVPGTTGGGSGGVGVGVGGPGKYAVWGGLGMAFAHGSFSNTNDDGPAGALGFEYGLNPNLSAEATLAFHALDGKGANADVDVTHLGVNVKFYFLPAPLRLFGIAGAGVYNFDPGSTRFGLNAGLGLQWQFTPQWSLEGRYTLHRVVNNSPRSSFSSLLLGVRYSF